MSLKIAERPQKRPKRLSEKAKKRYFVEQHTHEKEQKESLWNKIDTDSHNKTEICLRIDIKGMRFRIELWNEKELLKCGTLLHFLDGDYTNYII